MEDPLAAQSFQRALKVHVAGYTTLSTLRAEGTTQLQALFDPKDGKVGGLPTMAASAHNQG